MYSAERDLSILLKLIILITKIVANFLTECSSNINFEIQPYFFFFCFFFESNNQNIRGYHMQTKSTANHSSLYRSHQVYTGHDHHQSSPPCAATADSKVGANRLRARILGPYK